MKRKRDSQLSTKGDEEDGSDQVAAPGLDNGVEEGSVQGGIVFEAKSEVERMHLSGREREFLQA